MYASAESRWKIYIFVIEKKEKPWTWIVFFLSLFFFSSSSMLNKITVDAFQNILFPGSTFIFYERTVIKQKSLK